MISLTYIHLRMSQFFLKSQPNLTEQWAVRATKSVKIKPKFGIYWPAYGNHAWSHDHCPSDRYAQDWDVFTLCPVIPLVYVLEQLEPSSFMIARHRENPEHAKDNPRSSRPRITTPREDTSLVRTARQQRYAGSKTFRNLWNLGRSSAHKDSKTSPWTVCTTT